MKNNKALHIVSFDFPYPPNYGGILDVYNKVIALNSEGANIILHCFVKQDKLLNPDIFRSMTSELHLYPQKKISLKGFPFSVNTRASEDLAKRLLSDSNPVIFEGLQTTAVVKALRKKNRKNLFLRLHNDEENYYRGLYEAEKSFIRRSLYLKESKAYGRYQKRILNLFDGIFTISAHEKQLLQKTGITSELIYPFHGNKEIKKMSEKGKYVLYHGDLRTADNLKTAQRLSEIFSKTQIPLVIASDNNLDKIKLVSDNISLKPIGENLAQLLEEAHVNIVMSNQKSGTKLKIFNTLYNSRFSLIDENIIDDEDIQGLCTEASTENGIIEKTNLLWNLDYRLSEERKRILESFTDEERARKIMEIIF